MKSRDHFDAVADAVYVGISRAPSFDPLPSHPLELEPVPEAGAQSLSIERKNSPSVTGSLVSPCASPVANLTSTLHQTLDWVNLFAEMGCTSSNKDPNHISSVTFRRTNVVLESMDSYDATNTTQEIECIDVATLPFGEERNITRPVGDDGCENGDQEVEFVLTNERRRPVRVRCRWYRT